jgi:hypothetical protein
MLRLRLVYLKYLLSRSLFSITQWRVFLSRCAAKAKEGPGGTLFATVVLHLKTAACIVKGRSVDIRDAEGQGQTALFRA